MSRHPCPEVDEGILEVEELAGDRVVELRVNELHVVGLITCEWEGDVVAVVAPLGGVAQVVIVTESKSSECMERKERKKTGKCRWK